MDQQLQEDDELYSVELQHLVAKNVLSKSVLQSFEGIWHSLAMDCCKNTFWANDF